MKTFFRMVMARYVHKSLSTLLSIILFTIGVAVISLVIKSEWYLQNNYKKNLAGIDLVVGAKGSPLQLILSSVLHADVPTGNIPLEEVHKTEKNPLVKKAIPIALGDNYKGFRIVGTDTAYVSLYEAEMLEGKLFVKPLDAVLGANVVKKTGLKLNDNFVGVHGYLNEGHSHDEFKYTVTGILKPTGTIIDNLVLTPVESVWLVHSHKHHHHHEEVADNAIHDHHEEDHIHKEEAQKHHEEAHEHHEEAHVHKEEAKEHHEEAHKHHEEALAHNAGENAHQHENNAHAEEQPDENYNLVMNKIENQEELTEEEQHVYNEHQGILTEEEHKPENEITSLLIFYQNPLAVAMLPRMINENTTLQAASPTLEFNRLLSLLGYGIKILRILAWIIIIISGINIFIYLLNTINQSIREIALLRATGVSRPKIFFLIMLQGALLSVFGWIAGIILSDIIWCLMPWNSAVNIFTSTLIKSDLLLLLYCIVVAIMAGVIPAVKIYKTRIHYLLSR